jgi:hypothetical protein
VNLLFYFENMESTKPLGVIPLEDTTCELTGRAYQFQITHPQRRTVPFS